MNAIVIDIAWDKPTVAQIKATGATGVLRYFSTDSSKNLTLQEVTDYHAAGLGVGDVWETTTGRATQGYQAGIDDATAAEGQRAADGLPADQAIYFAVDEDTDWASVEPYFRGAAMVLGNDSSGLPRTGCYGGFRVIEGAFAFGLRRLWQTLAWSAGQKSAHAVLYQDGRTLLSGNADVNEVLAADWGQYPRPSEDPLSTFTKQDLIDAAKQGATAALMDPKVRALAVADDLWWWQHAISGDVPAGASPAAAAAIAAIHAAVKTLQNEAAPVTTPPPAKP